MKLFAFLNLAFAIFFLSSNAQSQHVNYYQLDSLDDDELKKGQVIVDFFYGGPNLNYIMIDAFWNRPSSSSSSSSNGYQDKITNLGPLGLRLDYMVDESNSIGFDVNYSKAELQSTYKVSSSSLVYNVTDVGTYERFRFVPRYCYHFRTDKLDAFYHAGIGMVFNTIKLVDGQTSYVKDPGWFKQMISVRTGIGLRYTFTKNWGIGADFGIGGPLVTFGINARL